MKFAGAVLATLWALLANTVATAYEFSCPSERGKALEACQSCSAQATGEPKGQWASYGNCLIGSLKDYGGLRVETKRVLGVPVTRDNSPCIGLGDKALAACLSCNAELLNAGLDAYSKQVSQCRTNREQQYISQVKALEAEMNAPQENERYAFAKAHPGLAPSNPSSYNSPSSVLCKRKAGSEVSTDAKVATFIACMKQEQAEYDAQQKAIYDERQEADRIEREKSEEEARKQREVAEAYEARRQKEAHARQKATAEKSRIERDQREADAKAKEDALIAACGADYKQVRIGMTVGRAQQCVAPFKLTGQLNRVDGVIIDSYQHCRGYSCTYLSVIDGRIAAWSK